MSDSLSIAARAPAYEYATCWRLDAPPERVWDALVDVEAWPRWWPYVRNVRCVRAGDADGLGAIHRIVWTSRLPYGFTLDVEGVESNRRRLLRGHATGDLEGEGLWLLGPEAGGAVTAVRYTWRLDLNTRWMRTVAPLMAPVFRWNHEGVMCGGGEGLARYLGARLLPIDRPPQDMETRLLSSDGRTRPERTSRPASTSTLS